MSIESTIFLSSENSCLYRETGDQDGLIDSNRSFLPKQQAKFKEVTAAVSFFSAVQKRLDKKEHFG